MLIQSLMIMTTYSLERNKIRWMPSNAELLQVVEIPRSLNTRQQLPALQQYVEEIRRLAAQDTPTIVAAPLVAAPPPR